MMATGTTRRKKKLTESERSPTILALLWQHDLNLKRQSGMLEKTYKSMNYRLTTSQKMVYKTFQKNMHQHDMAYARIMDDKKLEQQLRRKQSAGFRSNTNFSEDYDDDGLLKRIWYAGNTAKEEYRRDKVNEFSPEQMRPATAILHNTAMYLSGEAPKQKRARTSMSNKNASRSPSRGFSRATTRTPSPAKRLLDKRPATSFELDQNNDVTIIVNDDEDDEIKVQVPQIQNKNMYLETGNRPSTASGGINKLPRPQSNEEAGFYEVTTRLPVDGGTQSSASKHIYQGPDYARRPKLADLYKNFVSEQNHENRIQSFVNNVQEFRSDRDRMLKDYYAVRVVKESEMAQGENYVPHDRETVVNDAEYRQCVGNPNIRSHTFRKLKLPSTSIATNIPSQRVNTTPDEKD